MSCIGRPDIHIKLECNQFANSFKARGIISFLSSKGEGSLNGLVTFTTGNHGIAVSAIAKELSLPAIIVTTNKISIYKKMLINDNGATVQTADFYDLSRATDFAKQIAEKLNYTFIPLYDNDSLLNGYGEIADEVTSDYQGDFTIFFPIGSGSLLERVWDLRKIESRANFVSTKMQSDD